MVPKFVFDVFNTVLSDICYIRSVYTIYYYAFLSISRYTPLSKDVDCGNQSRNVAYELIS